MTSQGRHQSRQLRYLLSTPLGAVGSAVLIAALILSGLGVGDVGRLASLPRLSLLSISGPLGQLAPLSDEFVRRALGLPPLAAPLGKLGAAPDVSGAGADPRPPATTGPPPEPVVLNHPFDNDAFSAARRIPSVPYYASTDTRGATRQTGEPTSCAAVGGTAWYRYDPATDQALFADTFGTRYAVSLGVFSGNSIGALKPVSCNSSGGGSAQTGIMARRGTSYWFQLTGPVGGGTLAFHLVPVGTTRVLGSGARNQLALSGDGGTVAFVGYPGSRIPGSQLCPSTQRSHLYCQALFLGDVRTGQVRLAISTHPEATAFQGETVEAFINKLSLSADGRYVAFGSDDSHLIADDTNFVPDIFVLDTFTNALTRASVTSTGAQASFNPAHNNDTAGDLGGVGTAVGSNGATISADGRWVAFTSDSDNLAPNDDGAGTWDVFVHDRLTGRTRLVSVGADGRRLRGFSLTSVDGPTVSRDGSRVIFINHSSGLVCCLGDSAWVFDVGSGKSTRISDSRFPPSGYLGLSADGQVAAFYFGTTAEYDQTLAIAHSLALLGASQQEGVVRVTLKNLRHLAYQTIVARTQLPTSVPFVGENQPTYLPSLSLSADGRYIAFSGDASDIVPGDSNAVSDVFVRDARRAVTVRISLTSQGAEYSTASQVPVLSADGRIVLFLNNGSLLLHRSLSPGAP